MCGLFGWQVRPDVLKKESFIDMVRVLADGNDKRGGQSWGLYGVFPKGTKYYVKKGLGLILPQVEELCKYSTLMAHTRSATVGDITVENAHPFQVGNIIGAHNGCIHNHDELNKKLNRECTVDSQHIIHHLSEGRDFKEIEGGGVVEWVDVAEDIRKIYLCNVRGSLSVASLEDIKSEEEKKPFLGTLWSSSSFTLRGALKKLGESSLEYKESREDVQYIKNCIFYKSDKKIEFSFTKIPFRAYQSGAQPRLGLDDAVPRGSHYRVHNGEVQEYIPGVGFVSTKDRDTAPFSRDRRHTTRTNTTRQDSRGFGGSGDFGNILDSSSRSTPSGFCDQYRRSDQMDFGTSRSIGPNTKAMMEDVVIDSIRSEYARLEEESMFDEPGEGVSLQEACTDLSRRIGVHERAEERLVSEINRAYDNDQRRLMRVLNEERAKSIRRISTMKESLRRIYMKLEKLRKETPPLLKKIQPKASDNPLQNETGRVYYERDGKAYGAYCYQCYHKEMDYPSSGWDTRKLEHGKGRWCTVCRVEDRLHALLLVREPEEDSVHEKVLSEGGNT